MKITEWHKFNTALEYNAPCEKAEGFFFVPVSIAEELIGLGKCLEMDILLDLWLHAVYRDERVQGSELGGVVYFRDDSGNPILSYSRLADRWGISKATVCRVLKKLEERDYLVVMSFPGRYGSAIYLSGYLSTMFQISDVMLDKQEVALALELNVEIEPAVSEEPDCVSKPDAEKLLQKVAEFLSGQGLGCPSCKLGVCKLYELSGCTGKCFPNSGGYLLEIGCSHQEKRFQFEIQFSTTPTSLQNLANIDETIDSLRPHIRDISKRTYYRKRREAINILGSLLWGYADRDAMETLGMLVGVM